MKTLSHERSCTCVYCRLEPQNVTSDQLSDYQCLAPSLQDPETVSLDSYPSLSTPYGYALRLRKHHCICRLCQSMRLPLVFYGITDIVETQAVNPWIDEEDNTGGPTVRAVMSSVSPAVWSSVFQQSAYKAVSTYDMAQRRIEKQADNPKRKPIDRASMVRRAARQRAERMKRDD